MLKEEVLMYSFPLMILFLCSIHVKFLINFIWIMKSKSLLTWYWEGIVISMGSGDFIIVNLVEY